jgi:hypothetical protein
MLQELKKFALRGNVVDLAVGVIIGAAFGGIVNSLVGDIIMPVIGAVTGGLDFSNYYTALSSKVQTGASYADAKKRCCSWLGPVSHRRAELSYYRLGAVSGYQGHQSTENGRAPASCPGTDRRGSTFDRNPRSFAEVSSTQLIRAADEALPCPETKTKI